MSTPRTLVLPHGVDAVTLDTPRGPFAALEAGARGDSLGHILLIPGWTGSKEDFTPILPFLATAGFHVTAYDQRGQFETPGKPDDDYSLAGYATDALAVRAASGTPSSHLLGHSFGGLVAQNAAVADVKAWLSLSLLCTGPGALGQSESEARPLTLLAQAIGNMPLDQIHQYREKMAGIQRPPEIAAFLARRFESNGPESLKAMTQLLIDAPDGLDKVIALDLPKWVGRGKNDDAWPHEVQAEMAKRLGVEIVVIRAAAHSPAVENPEGLMEAWLPFLER
ncbi:MAG: alpha/beta hydrolase [Actinomycetota bacterium]|nr:alpha/beta hydrolase [Actinomycetota bacterium]